MNGDYSELVQYLDKKFNKIDEKFADIENKFTNIDGKFLLISGRLSNIEEILGKKADKEDLNNLLTAVDNYGQKADAYFQEMVMMSHKMERLENGYIRLQKK